MHSPSVLQRTLRYYIQIRKRAKRLIEQDKFPKEIPSVLSPSKFTKPDQGQKDQQVTYNNIINIRHNFTQEDRMMKSRFIYAPNSPIKTRIVTAYL